MIVLYTLVLEFNVKKKAILLTYLKSLIFFFVFLFQNFVLKTLTYYLPIFLREITWCIVCGKRQQSCVESTFLKDQVQK